MSKQRSDRRGGPRPEQTFGPYPGGISIAIWKNTTETDDGPRQFRSLTISPRRYRDAKTGEWRDASGFRATDIATLIFALCQAQHFLLTTPLRDDKQDEENTEDASF